MMKNETNKKALIYCRVSSKKQTKGSGLDSQEHRCRQYAASKGYEVEAVFPDDVTGAGDFMKRPGMVALLAYLQAQTDSNYVVIFDDLKRFARDTIFHWGLRHKLLEYGATVECLNFNFEDTPEGEFVETIVAAQGQLERQQNRRQTLQKMKARLEKGFFVFQAPIGYRYQKSQYGGKELVRNEPLASIMQEALEGFATGRFQIKAEVKHFLESFPDFPRGPSGVIGSSRIDEMLTRVTYAGYIEHKDWGVSLRKARHEGIINFEMFQKIQERLRGRANAPARKNINQDFPLRGFISCSCGKPLTAAWSKGRNTHYPYYFCQARDCSHYGKSIKREVIEGEFKTLLKQLTPTKELIGVASIMFEKLWNHRAQYQQSRVSMLDTEYIKIDRSIDKLLDRVVDAESPTVINALEKRVKALEEKKIVIQEKTANCRRPVKAYSDSYRTAMEFLAKPYRLWASDRLEDKRAVLKLAFADRLTYVRGEGYRTAKTTLPFKVLGDFFAQKEVMVGPGGLEPPTNGL